MPKPRTLVPFTLMFLATLAVGCGAGADQKPTATVTGKVTFNGEPVTGGSLTFRPTAGADDNKPGKPGSAVIGEDGTFSVGTYDTADGAVVGEHTISYSPPPSKPTGGAHGASEPSPYAGLQPKEDKVTVESGTNEVEVELVKK